MHHSIDRRAFLSGAAGLSIALDLRPADRTRRKATPFPPFASPPLLPSIAARDDGALKIVTSTTILADLARQIGGERVDVTSLLPPNADPHDYEPIAGRCRLPSKTQAW